MGAIDWAAFTPQSAIIGGMFIGLAAAILILGIGRILGMSGIANTTISQFPKFSWQLVFIIGMAFATWGYSLVVGFPAFTIDRPFTVIIIAGLLVGFGTQLGSGCTSGHGVCGLSRFSTRSLVATCTFMISGITTATLVNLFI